MRHQFRMGVDDRLAWSVPDGRIMDDTLAARRVHERAMTRRAGDSHRHALVCQSARIGIASM